MKQLSIFKYATTTGLFWGLIGGILLIIIKALPFIIWKQELLMMFEFAVCVIASSFTVLLKETDKKFIKVFITSLSTFILVPIVAHVYLFLTNISNYNFNWVGPFFMMLGIGTILCSALTWLVVRRR